jgi:hypothetical protein
VLGGGEVLTRCSVLGGDEDLPAVSRVDGGLPHGSVLGGEGAPSAAPCSAAATSSSACFVLGGGDGLSHGSVLGNDDGLPRCITRDGGLPHGSVLGDDSLRGDVIAH